MGCATMRDPPRDADGRVEPHDHDEIHDDDIVLRGVPRHQILPTEDGGRRISSGAFSRSSAQRDPYRSLSVSAKKILDCHETAIDEWADGKYGAVVYVPTARFRENGLCVGWDPTPDDPSHCGVWGTLPRSVQKELATDARQCFLD